MKNNITEVNELKIQKDQAFWTESTNEAFEELQKFGEVEDLLAPMGASSWDRIIEIETDEVSWGSSIDYLGGAVNEVAKALIKGDQYDDAIIFPLISVDFSNYTFKILLLIKFDDDESGECLYLKVYRKFYSNYGEYFYKSIDSKGTAKLCGIEMQEKINEFKYKGEIHYLGSSASLPYENFSSLLSNQILSCSAGPI
jgi:hypothetical protein